MHDYFQLQRLSDNLVYHFDRRVAVDGTIAYQRRDQSLWITYRHGLGWVAYDTETQAVMGRPWNVQPHEQNPDFPPEGEWVSKKGIKSYVYRLVYGDAKIIATTVALALGSNIGDRLGLLRAAVQSLRSVITVTTISSVYETAPAYVTDQPAFLNAALVGTTRLTPTALLAAVKKLESDLGRMPSFRYGPRVIDIDIIFMDDVVLAGDALTLPHPRMAEREFVLRPLTDVAPDWKHPVTGTTVAEMLTAVPSENPSCLGKILDTDV